MIIVETKGKKIFIILGGPPTFSCGDRVNNFGRDRMNEYVGEAFTATPDSPSISLYPSLTTLPLVPVTGFFFLFSK